MHEQQQQQQQHQEGHEQQNGYGQQQQQQHLQRMIVSGLTKCLMTASACFDVALQALRGSRFIETKTSSNQHALCG
jgi:hypothetical protein